MIKLSAVTKTYKGDVKALQGVDLEIPAAGMFGLLGVNGAGKTTLMRIIAGLLDPTEGRVEVFGHDLQTPKGKQAAKSLLGYLPQELGLYPNLSGREFLDYVAILKGITSRKQREAQINELIERVNLGDAAKRPIKGYSGGMKRRIGVAQALLGQPKVIIVDEPTAGLDPEERIRLRNLFGEVARDCAVILSTHIVEDISQSCRDLAVLSGGRVLFRGSPLQLIEQAQGHTWSIKTNGERPNHGLTVVSTMQLHDGAQYRVIGTPDEVYAAVSIEPSLEDGYMWLMRHSREEAKIAEAVTAY
jgi:ABC-2 type transport system ATP-binding protein